MIELRNVKKKYGNKVLFSNVNLKFNSPGVYSFVGDNGSGKSTLLNIIGGYIKPSRGKVLNKDISVSFMSQKTNLLESLSVREMFEMLDLDINLLRKVKLFSKREKYPRELSLGMQQRIALIVALYSKATCIILDEPTSHLDLKNAELIMKEIKKVSKTKIILLVNHNKELVERYSDFIHIIEDGQINLLKESNVKRSVIIDRSRKKEKWKVYYRNSLKNKKINFMFIIVFVLLFFIEFMFVNLENGFSIYLNNKEKYSLDYNKFYLRECTKIKEGNIVLKRCENLNSSKVNLLKNNYKVVINYDAFLNDLYNTNNLSVVSPSAYKLKEGNYPSKYNEVVASSDYEVGDEITLDTTKIVHYNKIDIYKNKLVLNVVGISEDKPFIQENNIYLDYSYIDGYLEREMLKNNGVSLKQYFNEANINNYKYVLFFDDVDLSVLEVNNIDYLSSSYEYYESLKDSFKEIIEYFNYFNIVILITFLLYTVKLVKKKIGFKENDILFFKAASIKKRKIIKLINRENAFFIKIASFLSFIIVLIVNYVLFKTITFELPFGLLFLVVVLSINKILVKREIRRRVSI